MDRVTLTTVGVGLRAVAVLQTVGPGALILGVGGGGLTDSIATLEALSPFASVEPAAARLHPQPVALAVLPLAFEGASAAKYTNLVTLNST